MEQAVYDALKETCGDKTVTLNGEEKSLFEIAVDWEEGVRKTRDANKDLTGQRETWEREKREFKSQLDETRTKLTEAQSQLDETTNKTKKKDQQSEQAQKEINTLTDKINSLTELYEAAEKARKEEKERSIMASRNIAVESLKSDIIKELNNHKIIGNQATIALNTIIGQGYAKVVDGDEGAYQRSFSTYKDGKELNAESLNAMCETFAKDNPFLVSGSGTTGTGNNHTSNSNESGNNQNYFAMLK